MIKNVIKHLFIILINTYNKIVLVLRKNLIKRSKKDPLSLEWGEPQSAYL